MAQITCREIPLVYSVEAFADRIDTLWDNGGGLYADIDSVSAYTGQRPRVYFDVPLCSHCEHPLADLRCDDCGIDHVDGGAL